MHDTSVLDDARQGDGSHARGMPFISVAFAAALVFVPVVIATGLLTDRSAGADGIALADLRSGFDDAGPPIFRPTLRDP